MSRILAICGKKTSGKSTLCNFLHGYQLKSYGIIDDFDLTDKGKLIIKSKGENDELIQGMVDINRRDEEFAAWAAYNVWPFVKQYSFARALKEMCVGLFNVPYEAIYGTNEQKEQKIPHLLWENMPGVVTSDKLKINDIYLAGMGGYPEAVQNLEILGLTIREAGPMSGREFMQFLGTEIMRKMYADIWAKNTLEEIQSEGSLLALVDDGRFDNEITPIQSVGGKAIQLLRVDSDDQHSSENGFVETKFDAVLDARGLSIREMCEALMVILNGWGWLGEHSE
jgi:energy-coupling factor transporter ATP-binding protein EcfA2